MKRLKEKHLTLREKILETIRDAIISGSITSGSRVSEPDLPSGSASRTPIREAFRQLGRWLPDGDKVQRGGVSAFIQ